MMPFVSKTRLGLVITLHPHQSSTGPVQFLFHKNDIQCIQKDFDKLHKQLTDMFKNGNESHMCLVHKTGLVCWWVVCRWLGSPAKSVFLTT